MLPDNIITNRTAKLPDDLRLPPLKRKHKYNARKTIVDGVVFDSKAEAKRYVELRLLEDAKEIISLELQPEFILQEKCKDKNGKTIRQIKYIADFKYFDVAEDRWIVLDVKGFETPVFKIKEKLFRAKYWNYELKIFKEK